MTNFLRLLADTDKQNALIDVVSAIRGGTEDARVYQAEPDTFHNLPGASFAYWVNDATRAAFVALPAFEDAETRFVAKRGVNSNDDFRFLRVAWEVQPVSPKWVNHPKGGPYSPFYADVYLVLDWHPEGRHLDAERVTDRVYAHAIVPSRELYFRPGLTWSLRTKSKLSMRVMPSGCAFGSKGPAVIEAEDSHLRLLAALAICNSNAFYKLIEIQLAAADAKPGGAAHSFEVGVIQRTPLPHFESGVVRRLSALARRAWSQRRTLDTVEETSHAFHLPAVLRARLGDYDPSGILAELTRIQTEIDTIAFDQYGFAEADRVAAPGSTGGIVATAGDDEAVEDEAEEDGVTAPVDQTDALLSWAVGVAFGRFDWRLASGERAIPPEPDPFDPLPAKSPGMLPDETEPFHRHAGFLVDDPGHSLDLGHLMEEVFARVDAPVTVDLRRWLRRDFFPLHFARYSKSRRKAPIYWPLSTASGGYTLWIYYPDLTSQTLYTAVNDLLEPKLKEIEQEAAALRARGTERTREEDRRLEAVLELGREVQDLRDELLRIAPKWQPNHDDGVQITAAPLWTLFRHKPWSKLLKETWAKLEKGDYDWAHLAMTYWPDRVREKCRTDKSLAIAHGLEDLYEEPAPAKAKGRRKKDEDA